MQKFCRQIFLFFLCLWLIGFAAHAQTPTTVAANPTVQIVAIDIQSDTSFADYRDTQQLIPFHSGQWVSKSEITTTLEALKKLEWVKNLTYTIVDLPNQGVNLTIAIEELRMVRGISVKGNYPFLSKQIKRLIPLQPGSPFDTSLIARSRERRPLRPRLTAIAPCSTRPSASTAPG